MEINRLKNNYENHKVHFWKLKMTGISLTTVTLHVRLPRSVSSQCCFSPQSYLLFFIFYQKKKKLCSSTLKYVVQL